MEKKFLEITSVDLEVVNEIRSHEILCFRHIQQNR
jgi:hypothetical protein